MQEACDRYLLATGAKLNQGTLITECLLEVLPPVPGEPPVLGPGLLKLILESFGGATHTNGDGKAKKKPPSKAVDRTSERRSG